ncbi:nucleotidyltransferase domain-containing protein [Halocatena salina]|uniref:Nucleotidyltransferase domain-containing protein n=1 Tax=Halocatena salina TaxID=2934340 RepID=A0A8U0AB16_9EURY|nr:nucleotidyltransferase domain-containing protein [Halocatena salina]UPM45093.1 nucleotidyltransferase domain-containing protein [Halocatena salina]
MTSEDLGLTYSEEEIRTFIEEAVAQKGTQYQPRFYAVTGSHVYGFDSSDSDIDVRGIHVAPAEEYAYLQTPVEEVTINMDGTTEGFETYADIDLRSYELKKFGSLLAKANYNVIELVFEAPTVMNGLPLEMDALEALIREHLPMNVPHAYLGMAKSNYYKHLDPEKPVGYDPRPKEFLYVYRGLLGAKYVLDHEDIEANVQTLATAVDGGNPELVEELINHKREIDEPTVPDALEQRTRAAIVEQFNALDALPTPDKSGYHDALDDWMHNVRI